MGKLEGRIAVIAGGAGNVGEGVVRAFLAEGATVVVPSRRADRLDRLRADLAELATERLVTCVGDVGTAEAAEQLRADVLNRFGRLNVFVASLGGWWQVQPLIEVPVATWEQILRDNLTSHFVAARTFMPILVAEGRGSYTLVGGAAAETPVTEAGPFAIAAAGRSMLTRVLAEELKGSGVRVNEVMLGAPVIGRRRKTGRPEWLTVDEVGAFVAWLASDEARMVNGSILRLSDRPSLAHSQNP